MKTYCRNNTSPWHLRIFYSPLPSNQTIGCILDTMLLNFLENQIASIFNSAAYIVRMAPYTSFHLNILYISFFTLEYCIQVPMQEFLQQKNSFSILVYYSLDSVYQHTVYQFPFKINGVIIICFRVRRYHCYFKLLSLKNGGLNVHTGNKSVYARYLGLSF